MAITRLNNNSVTSVSALPNLASLPSGIPTGKVGQVVAGSSAGVVTVTTTSYTTICTVNITPTATSSKILLIGTIGEPDFFTGQLNGRFFVGSTEISSSEEKVISEMGRGLSNVGSETHRGNVTQSILHSPNTTSQVTYTIKIKCNQSGSVRAGNGGSNTIIAQEILA